MKKQNTTTSKTVGKKKNNPNSVKKKQTKNKTKKVEKTREKKNIYLILFSIFMLGVLLIFSAYAWFSTALNVQVRTFNMVVTKNSGLTISLDGINFDSYVDISKVILIDELKNTYPNNRSQWASNGLIPVSSPGITNPNSYFFDIYSSNGVMYKNRNKDRGYVTTILDHENYIRQFNYIIAFDLFLKNDSGSPVSDNLYLDDGTGLTLESEEDEEMSGLINSVRFGFVKVGSVPMDTDVETIQNIQCNNDCRSIIYEPNDTSHTDLSIERARKYGINLVDGQTFPTYSYIRAGGPFLLSDTVSGSANLDPNYFALQQTISNRDFDTPLFQIPDGITKMRVYVWIEGQDIDSLETNSEGSEVAIIINLVKDTVGYTTFN